MKNAGTLGLMTLFILFFLNAYSQELEPVVPRTQKPAFFAGGQASTNGLGLNMGYILNKRISFRTGFETLKFGVNFDFDESDVTYDANLNYKTGGIFLVADFFYTRALYLSGGASFNNFNPEITGHAISDLEYGDITIPSSEIGEFHFTIEPARKVSPYLAAGVRQFLGKKQRLLFNFEAGFYYIGSPKINIEATGLLAPTADPAHGQQELLENQIENYKIYPILKLNFAYIIF